MGVRLPRCRYVLVVEVVSVSHAVEFDIRATTLMSRCVTQSYYNFSVGGAISVNCHGRGNEFGTISETIVSMDVLTVDGVEINNVDVRHELFPAIVGGYSMVRPNSFWFSNRLQFCGS
jgi:hypothetical protein